MNPLELNLFLSRLATAPEFSCIDRIALASWPGPEPLVSVVFDVGGRWLHAADYAVFDEEDWDSVDVLDHAVIWTRP